MKHPIRRRLMYLGFQGLRASVQWLPWGVARRLGEVFGLLAYGALRAQRRLTKTHLAHAFGASLTLAEQRRVARGVFRNLGASAMEWLKLPQCSSADLQRRIVAEGLEHLRTAMARGRGAIVVTAHFGNWELISPYLKSVGFEGGVLARRLRYPEYESFLISARGAKGIPTFARGSLKEVARILRANQIIGMLPDQDVDSLEGIFVDFFGRPAYTPVGPAALSLMTGAPIVPCFMIRDGSRFRLVIEPPVAVPAELERTQALRRLTQAWSATVESYIRRFPEQWVWMHRRWKTQPTAATSPHTKLTVARAEKFGVGTSDPSAPLGAGKRQVTAHASATCDMRHATAQSSSLLLLVACCLLLVAAIGGCAKSGAPMADGAPPADRQAAAPAQPPEQQMDTFTLTSIGQDGATQWTLTGQGASGDGTIVTILRPDATGYDPGRTAYLTASAAQFNQKTRHARMEHDVTIHTSDGLWLTTPILHWMPDRDEMATDQPVRIETDHMLLRGRGATGHTELKHATLYEDIELVLNPGDHEPAAGKQVTITCDGPLQFDYENHIATFEQNVHVQDPSGDLYSDKLIAYLDQVTRTIRYAEAIGRVRIVQQQNTAHSERAIYEPAIGKITLVGRPSLLVYPSEQSEQGPRLSFGGLVPAPGQAGAAAPRPADPDHATTAD